MLTSSLRILEPLRRMNMSKCLLNFTDLVFLFVPGTVLRAVTDLVFLFVPGTVLRALVTRTF
jgi:hypothetical protein